VDAAILLRSASSSLSHEVPRAVWVGVAVGVVVGAALALGGVAVWMVYRPGAR